ncbi:hypothetical protein [Aeromonas jandaei]|uniref:hypothetical protein n=1 Tax=Aeromonas jandaei TaxID=650 RepID=UPI001ADD8E79|nr:hypothetical protein [Aeromonas jandaei]QTL94359.1 hypothetical protein AjGTCBM29_02222 [Aeromonas jandaei]
MYRNALLIVIILFNRAEAKESFHSPHVIGHKPTIASVYIDKVSASLGDTLNVIYNGYTDIDGDVEGVPSIQWLRDGAAVTGATTSSYTVRADSTCRDFAVAVEVTPKSLTGDPLIGDAKQSPPLLVVYSRIPNFRKPDTVRRNWSDADAYCKAHGLILPTIAQLQSVFNNTSGGTNIELATQYGWPLSGQCGGTTNIYWANDMLSNNSHGIVLMNIGNAFSGNDNNAYHVACVR